MSRLMLFRLVTGKGFATSGRVSSQFAGLAQYHSSNDSQISGKNARQSISPQNVLSMNSRRSINSERSLRLDTLDTFRQDKTIDQNPGEEKFVMSRLERNLSFFEDLCQRTERVGETNFVKTFKHFTRSVEELESLGDISPDIKVNLSVMSGILLRCCGRLMSQTPVKAREMFAGNVWNFIKEKKIPLDTSLYNILIKVLNENQTTIEPQTILDEMKAANLEPDRVTYQRLIHQYCVQGNVTSATSLLEVMQEKNMELTEATFASLIIGYSLQEDPPSINELFELMKTKGIEPGGQSYAAAILTQARLLNKDASKATEELNKLCQLVEGQDIQFSFYEVYDLLSNLGPLKEHEVVAKIIDLSTRAMEANIGYRQRLIAARLESGQIEEASNQFWSREPSYRERVSGVFGNFYIRLLATTKNVPADHAIAECSRLIGTSLNLNALHQLYFLAANAGNLTTVRAVLKKIGETENLKCQYYWPLLAQAHNNNEVLSVLKNDLNPKMNCYGLLETFSVWVWPRFSDNPNVLFEHNKVELKYDNGVLITSYLDYCVSSGKIMEAIKFVSEFAPSDQQPEGQTRSEGDVEQQDTDEFMSNQRTLDRVGLINRLLSQIGNTTKDPALVDKAFALFNVPDIMVTSRMLTPVIKARLEHSNFEAALDCFLNFAEKYNFTPCKFDMMIRCLENKDSDSLRKIMDVSSKIHGETNSLFDLACACIKCGKMKQATKILSSPGLRVHSARVYRACGVLFETQKLDVLENFVFATKDLPDVSNDYLYEILLNAYKRTGTQKRALDLWDRMQDDDFQPSRRVLVHMAKVLNTANIPVPFQVPKTASRNSSANVREKVGEGETA